MTQKPKRGEKCPETGRFEGRINNKPPTGRKTGALAILIILAFLGFAVLPAQAREPGREGESVQVTGVLKLEKRDGSEFLAIASDREISLRTEDGELLTARILQLAGLDQKKWDEAKRLANKNAHLRGRLMARHTVHHMTPILLLVDTISP